MTSGESQRTDVSVTATNELSESEHREWRHLNTLVHGPPQTRPNTVLGLVFGGTDDTVYVIRLRLDATLVGVVFVTERSILIDGQRVHAGGLRGMSTHPDHRRRGFGRIAMQRAADLIWDGLHVDLRLLLSSEMAVPFYLSLGWRIFDGTLMCEQPAGVINCTLRLPREPPMILHVVEPQRRSGRSTCAAHPW